MTTARYLITNALRTIGVLAEGQALQAEDGVNCLIRLNDLLDSWAIESLFANSTTEYTGAINGASVSIGPTGNVVTPHTPTRLEGGFIRSGNLDIGFELVSYQSYADVIMKTNVGPWPSIGYYDGVGTLLLYPSLGSAELHVSVLERLNEFATLDTNYVFTPGVRRALSLSMAEEMAPEYSKALPPSVMQLALRARRTLKRANHVVPQLDSFIPANIYSTGFGVGGVTYDGVDGGGP